MDSSNVTPSFGGGDGEARKKYILAFNNTMLKIWREQISLLDVIDTGRLLKSPKSVAIRADGRFIEATLSQGFLEYGLWQDFGTGKEIPRGNPGDIGRDRKRSSVEWYIFGTINPLKICITAENQWACLFGTLISF